VSQPEYPEHVPKPLSERKRTESVVIVNTGDGKGKSSSAFGVMGRAWARGWSVGVVQFIKGAEWNTGERKLADHLGVEWHTMGDGFTWDSSDLDQSRARAVEAWQRVEAMLQSGDYQLLILDELTYPVTWEWIDPATVAQTIAKRSPKTNVIITGRDAAPELIEIADTVSDVRNVKHAYDAGIMAIKGIDY